MLNTNHTIACLLAIALASPLYAADPNIGTPGNPNCTASGKPVIPNQFYIDLSKELSWEASLGLNPWDEEVDEVDLEEIRREGANRKFHSIAPKLERRPDFQHRLMQWRINHHLPPTVDCSLLPLDVAVPRSQALAPTANALPGITTVPQHSLANNIFRKKLVFIDIFDSVTIGNPFTGADGDMVDIWFNGAYKGRFTLPPDFLSTTLGLTLEPSDTLPAKKNILKFKAVNVGTARNDGIVSLGVRGHNGNIFPGSDITIGGAGTTNLRLNQQVSLDMALGLACVDPVAYPQSAIHIQDAQKVYRFPRIVSPDRKNGPARRVQNTAPWKKANAVALAACKANRLINPTGETCDVDEYPQAMFLENQAATPGGGRPHMRAIPSRDNKGSGAKIGNYASRTLYFDADPKSPILARRTPDNLEIIVPIPGGKLFCKNAF